MIKEIRSFSLHFTFVYSGLFIKLLIKVINQIQLIHVSL